MSRENRKKYSWNPVYNTVMDIKDIFIHNRQRYCYPEAEKAGLSVLEYWIEELDKLGYPQYKELFQYLTVTQEGNLVLIKYGMKNGVDGWYTITKEKLWHQNNDFYMETRSIVIDLLEETIVIAPYKKFLNFEECEENSLENITAEIAHADSVEFSNKLDGSMQCATWYKGDIVLTGSHSLNLNNSWRLEDGYSKLTDSQKEMIKKYPDFTFIFEYIAKKDAHVVKYTKEQEGMYLTGIRNNTTGGEAFYKYVLEIAEEYNSLATEIYYGKTFQEALQDIKTMNSAEQEGYVINIITNGEGRKIKLKGDDYVEIHKVLTRTSSTNFLIHAVADGNLDDVWAKIPDAHKERCQEIIDQLYNYINQAKVLCNIYFNQLIAMMENPKDKANFMKLVDRYVPKEFKGYVRNIYLGKENNYLMCGNRYKKMNELIIEK